MENKTRTKGKRWRAQDRTNLLGFWARFGREKMERPKIEEAYEYKGKTAWAFAPKTSPNDIPCLPWLGAISPL